MNAISPLQFGIFLFGTYILLSFILALKGMKKTKSLKSFALGQSDMSPFLVGITLAASIASTATFVINPGFVYSHGISALLHFSVAGLLGMVLALWLFSKKFRHLGLKNNAITLPHWIGAIYKDRKMRLFFSLLNLALSLTFIVLILKGSALVLKFSFGLSYFSALSIIVATVFSYILMGGTYAHAYTNALQGVLMIVVAGILLVSGWDQLISGEMVLKLSALDPNLVKAINPNSPYFSSFFEVFICGFLVSLGLVCQPHILTKSMYLKDEKQVKPYLFMAMGIGSLFALVPLAGLFAKISFPNISSQDAVMAFYISKAFNPFVAIFISVALISAGMSTLDGILVSASTIAANDILLSGNANWLLAGLTKRQKEKKALALSRLILLILGISSYLVALNPPKLVGVFAQLGIYGLVAASLSPILFGVFIKNPNAKIVFASSILGAFVHFSLYFTETSWFWIAKNPAATASLGILSSLCFVSLSYFILKLKIPKSLTPIKKRALS